MSPARSSSHRTRVRRAAVASGVLTLVATLSGCGGDEGAGTARDQAEQAEPSPSSTTPSATTSPSPDDTGSPSSSGQGGQPPSSGGDQGARVPTDTSPRTYDGPADETGPAVVSDIRVGRHQTYDRVVIDFATAGGLPDYDIRWLKPGEQPRAPGSGKSVTLESNRVLSVRLPHTRDREPGHGDLKPRLPAVREVRDFGSFEQQTQMYIGVKTFQGSARVVGFRVKRLSGGTPRLVIDVAHADAYDRAKNG